MINVTGLLCGTHFYGDRLRYGPEAGSSTTGTGAGRGPVVVWNCTRRCNLNCVHCYMEAVPYSGEEMSTAEAGVFLDDLAEFRVPVLLISGGEPLMRPDFFDLAARAVKNGLRTTLSTNGTLISRDVARDLKRIGISYVGISLDGTRETHDRFRNSPGSFERALEAIHNCRAVGQKVGLRFTITRYNCGEVEEIFRLVEEEGIPRVCFYHLVNAGRGREMDGEISHEQTRGVLDLIISRAVDFSRRGLEKEILTVDNHADGVYLYLYMARNFPERAGEVLQLLRRTGGNRSGIAIGAVDPQGGVHPDQFTQQHTLGNVRERPFSEIWSDDSHPLLSKLRDRAAHLKGRCRECRWLDICSGNLRSRAELATGDFWASDPGCYLTDEEIGLAAPGQGRA